MGAGDNGGGGVAPLAELPLTGAGDNGGGGQRGRNARIAASEVIRFQGHLRYLVVCQ
jgi:hypothetical protein